MTTLRRTASVTWTGSAREGRGTFRVGSGALVAPFTYNSRFKGDSETNPEELLLAAQAGCLTMALAAAFKEKQIEPGTIETFGELDLVPYESGGYRIPSMRLDMTVSDPDPGQDQLDAALVRAIDMCPICNALAGTDIQVTVHPADTDGLL
jgi:osmotically inducible protein OsmC